MTKPTGKPRKPNKRKRPLAGAAKHNAKAAKDGAPLHAQAWRMWVDEGLTYREIGERFEIGLSTARDWVNKAAAEIADEAAHRRKTYSEAAIERLRKAAAISYRRHASADGEAKDLTAAIAAEKRIADIIGLDAPKAIQVTGEGGGPLRVTTMTDAELSVAAGEG